MPVAQFDRAALLSALQFVGKVPPWQREGRAGAERLPGVVRITTAASRARLECANFDAAIGTEIDCQADDMTFHLPLVVLTKSLEKSNSDALQITVDEHSAILRYGRSRFSLWGEPQDMCPAMLPIEGDPFAVPAIVLREGLKATECATGSDPSAIFLGGVYIHGTARGVAFTASDKARIHTCTIDGAEVSGAGAILPRSMARLLLSLLPEAGDVSVTVSRRGALFKWGGTQFRSKLIDAQYPINAIQMPPAGVNVLRGQADAILDDINLAATVDQRANREIALDLGPICHAFATANNGDWGSVEMPHVEWNGPPLNILFRMRVVSDALGLFGSDLIEWWMAGARDQTTIASLAQPGLEIMVAPMLPSGPEMRRAA
jgi:DNA polymerase-3 subunit beta